MCVEVDPSPEYVFLAGKDEERGRSMDALDETHRMLVRDQADESLLAALDMWRLAQA